MTFKKCGVKLVCILCLTLLISCSGASSDSSSISTDSSSETSSNTELGTISTPSLTVSSLPSAFSVLSPHITKYSEVFGIHIFATPDVTDQKIIHAANILAQYLDNNEDGTVDNALVLTQLRNRNASIFITPTEASFESLEETLEPLAENLSISAFQTLFETEIAPSSGFDASLEELLHLITENGYAHAYNDIFGERTGTSIGNAMDIARGGQFLTTPTSYPSSAWYTYDDSSCDYACMITEYFYWGLTSILGAHANRSSDINHEWQLHTRSLVQTRDTTLYSLLIDSEYVLPTTLPDGSYSAN